MNQEKDKCFLKSSPAQYLFVSHQNIDCFSWQVPLEMWSVDQLDQKLSLVNLIFKQSAWVYEGAIMLNQHDSLLQ